MFAALIGLSFAGERDATATTTVSSGMGGVMVDGGSEDNVWVIEDSIRDLNPAPVPLVGFTAPPTREALTRSRDELMTRMRVLLGEAGTESSAMTRVMQVVRLATKASMVLAMTQLEGDNIKPDETRTPKRVVLVHDRSSTPIVAVPPCREVRYGPSEQAPTGPNVKTVGCPIDESAASNVFTLGRMPVYVEPNDGDDRVALSYHQDVLTTEVDGGSGNDKMNGSRFEDGLIGGWGNDTIQGGAGDDMINGPGDPTMRRPGEPDRDALFGEDGGDRIKGGPDIDLIDGGDGDDDVATFSWLISRTPEMIAMSFKLFKDDLNTREMFHALLDQYGPQAVAPHPALTGDGGNDTIIGGPGIDSMNGGHGRDTILARESDFGARDEIDMLADCAGEDQGYGETFTPPAPVAEEDEYFRATPGSAIPGSSAMWADPIRSCDTHLQFSIGLQDLITWSATASLRNLFYWYALP